jgi:site-specific DNA recombinase
LSADEVLSEAQTLYDRWPKMATDEKRQIAESLIEKLVIGDGEIDITLSHLSSSEDMTKSQQQLRGLG